jgi:multidrug efflux pump subunit AcrB
VDGRLSIALQARKKALPDEVHTAAAVREFVNNAVVPPGVELVMVADISRLTTNMLDVLVGNAMLGLVSVFLLLFYFLHARFAAWVAVGIPFAVCLAFLVLAAINVTMNAMTLTAIILMMGILVDDAVVVSENTKRLRQEGMAPLPASIQGAQEVAQPVIFSALTTMLAFAPLLFLTGPNGDFMHPFPLAVIVLLLASLFESLCLLPGHLAHVPAHIQPPERPRFARMREAYHRFILRGLQRRGLTLAVFVLIFCGVMAAGAATIRFSLFPDIDIDTVQVKVELPVGSRFEETVAAVERLEAGLFERVPHEDLLNITSQVGHHDTDFYGATEGRNHAWALISIQLQPLGRRATDINTYQLVQELQGWAAGETGFASLEVQAQTDVPVMGKPVEVEVISNSNERFSVADKVLAWLRRHPGVTSSWTSYNPGKDVIDLQINHALLASRGLTVEQLIRAVSVAVDGLLVDELQTLDERVRYRLALDPDRAGQLDSLRNLAVINDRGEPVYLSSVAQFQLRPGEADIKHYFGKRTVTVFAEIDDQLTSAQQINAELGAWLEQQDWPETHPQLRIYQGGELEETAEAFGELGMAAIICLLSIFAALVVLFNSVTQPILILICIPFGLVGVILCYMVQGLSMGMMAITGIIGLVGVLVNDSLVLMHALNRERVVRDRLLRAEEVAAVARRRFRPIFITSVTTAVGLFPTAYGIMGENSYISPMVMSMAWGVVFGGLVSLVLLPVLYMLEQDIRRLVSRRQY